MQQMERHDDLAVGAELHSTVESPMELVERQRSAFYNPLTVAKEDDDILSSLLHEDGERGTHVTGCSLTYATTTSALGSLFTITCSIF